MSVISISVPVSKYATLTNVALKMGVQADRVDVDEDARTVYVDLLGEPFRALKVATSVGATCLAYVDKIEHGEVIKSRPVNPYAG